MEIYGGSIGELDADGTVKTEATVCALTGISIIGQHATQQMLGKSRHFVRVVSQRASQLTEDVQAELLASVEPKSAPKPTPAKSADAAKEGG